LAHRGQGFDLPSIYGKQPPPSYHFAGQGLQRSCPPPPQADGPKHLAKVFNAGGTNVVPTAKSPDKAGEEALDSAGLGALQQDFDDNFLIQAGFPTAPR
jgi:hypothetical protein